MRYTRVTVDPTQMGGVPCIRGLRIPAATVIGMIADGMSETEILRAFPDRGKADGPPLIVMERRSGLRGLIVVYPEQKYDAIVPYPFTIQGRGEGIYIVNINGGNPYQFVDLMSYRCDRHVLDRVFGAPLKVGIAVGGGSVGGQIRNANVNPGWWTFSHFRDCPGTPPPGSPRTGPFGNPAKPFGL